MRSIFSHSIYDLHVFTTENLFIFIFSFPFYRFSCNIIITSDRANIRFGISNSTYVIQFVFT